MSPRTPVSPRKTQNCLFIRDMGTDALLHTPPESPTKTKLPFRPGVLQFPAVPRLDSRLASPPFDDVSPIKKHLHELDGTLLRHSTPLSSSNSHLSLEAGIQLARCSELLSDETPSNITNDFTSSSQPEAHGVRDSVSDSPADILPLLWSDMVTESTADANSDSQKKTANTNTSDIAFSSRLHQLPVRHTSSPLRPSQWTARGGLLKCPRHQTKMPDRFIPSRRPPNITRESFELNKPAHRLTAEEKRTRNGASTVDPFGRQLHRSGRLNEELRSLRETHSVLTGRTGMNPRTTNPSLRRSSFTQGVRNISAGAVWTVGGSSAASDTVVAVSNGRGGMLGSGTNAPLYTSMFLSRSDPEAELEAYERRLALALDVDQTDRVLQHTTPNSSPLSASPDSQSSPGSRTKHIWRDNAWNKDGVASRLLNPLRLPITSMLIDLCTSNAHSIQVEEARTDPTVQIGYGDGNHDHC